MTGPDLLRAGLLGLVLLLAFNGELQADNIRLFGKWTYAATDSERTDRETQQVTDSESERVRQSYRFDFSKGLYPALGLKGGVQVEKEKFTIEGSGSEVVAEERELQPYIDLELDNRLYSLSTGYSERRIKNWGTILDGNEREIRETFDIRAFYRPVDLPQLELIYVDTRRYDEPLTSDVENENVQISSSYGYGDYQFAYNLTRNEENNKITGIGNETTIHNGRVRYSNSYLDGRVALNGRLRAEYTDQSFSGTGPRDFAVFPAGSSFYFIDDDANPNNNLATDYTQTPDFGTLLDLNADEFIDVGLSFGEPVTVDLLQLSLSAELDNNSNIALPANWDVYASDDQETWQTLPLGSVVFEPDGNLLEIRIDSNVEQDFFMAVYSPPLATNQVGPVTVTAIRAFVTRELSGGTRLESQTHNAQANLGWQATAKTDVNYTFNLQHRKVDVFDDETVRLSNGLNLQHRFDDVFSSSGRFFVTDNWQKSDHETRDYFYSAQLTAKYLPTLDQSLVYSGSRNEQTEGDSTTDSVYLRTNARLYRGWDLNTTQGYSLVTPATGDETESFFVAVKNSIVPHARLKLFADYTVNWSQAEGEERERVDTGRFRLSWVPLDSLSFNGIVRLRRDDLETLTSWVYSVSWLPLRDGDLLFSVSFSEEEDQRDNRTRSLSSTLNWEVTHYASLRLFASAGEAERLRDISEFRTLQADFRVYFN